MKDEIESIPLEPDVCDTKTPYEHKLKFQLDYLVKMCYAEEDGENCRLNSKGLDLLTNIK